MKETIRIMIDSIATCFGYKTANMELQEYDQDFDELLDDYVNTIYKNSLLNYWNEKYEEVIAGLGLLLFFAVVTIIFII